MICPSCGERNPDGAWFCLRCGSPLSGRIRRNQERKIVTVLFCDLVGFTERSDRADPEDVKATLRPYHAVIARVVAAYGGTLDSFVGDGVVGVFGAPTAHEDDPERATRAAFRILDEITQLNESLPSASLAVRIGVETGEAMVAVGPGPQLGERVTGDVVGQATRLQAMAPVGGIAVGDATRRAAADRFDFERLPAGEDGPPAWRAVEISRLVRERSDTPFVGRTNESALLRATFRRCVGESSVQLMTVLGEPGVGKSRLVQEFAEQLDAEPELVRWRVGRCPPYGDGIGFWPLSEIVKAEAGVLGSDPHDETRWKLARSVEAVVEDPSEREWLLARLAPLAGLGDLGASRDRTETFTAWRRYLEALASQHPLVLVFEDLHWADPALLEFVEHVADWSTGLPMLLLCVGRPELLDRRPGWGGGKRNATTLALPPLSGPETAMLVSGLLDRAVLPGGTQRALLERAGGNPLYAEEFVRMLTDRGLLADGGEAASVDGEIPVPETIQAIIGARLDTLPFDTKALLRDAAVIGRTFWAGAVAEVSGLAASEAEEGLRRCAELELIRPVRSSSVRDDREYTFWHILVRDVAYAQIPRAERARKHRAVAGWIERVAGDRVADQAEVLAHHYGEALSLTRSTGADDTDLPASTVRYLTIAADRSMRVDARSAERHLRRALELAPAGSEGRPAILVRLGDVETTIGRFVDARAHFDEAIDDLRSRGDRIGMGGAIALKTRSLHRLGDMRAANDLLEEAVSILEAERPGPELARAYSRIAGHHLMMGSYEQSLEFAERTLRLAEELGLEDELVRARQNRGAARCELGDAGGLADLWAALRQGLELGIGVETAVTYGNLAYQLWLLDGPAISLQVWESAIEFAEVRGFQSELNWGRCGLMEVLFDLGRWDELVEIALQVEAWDREEGGGQMRTFAEFSRAAVLVHRGELQPAVLLEEEVLPRVRILQRPEFLAPALATGALLEERRGHGATALALVEEFVRATDRHDSYRLQFLPDVARVLAAAGRADRLEELVTRDTRVVSTRTRHALATASALLAEARGELATAADAYAASAAGWLSYGSILERAEALFGEGRCRDALGMPGAEERLREAGVLFAGLKAEPRLRAVEAARSRSDGRGTERSIGEVVS